MIFFSIYLAVVSFAAIVLTVVDKRRARRRQYRIPERVLLLFSALGGSVAMLLTMMLIHHKTRHLKFMLGIPVIIVLQLAVFILVWRLTHG